MKEDSRALQVTQFVTLLAIAQYYDVHRRLGNAIDRREGVMEQRVAQLMCRRILDQYDLRVDVEGTEHVADLERRYCIVSNHLSYLDWVVHLAHFPKSPIFIAKKEVTWYPVICPYLRSRGLLIDRKAGVGARQAISVAADQDVDWPILIFPEGTRSRDGELQEFRRGGMAVIAQTGLPMVPAVIVGSHEAFPRGGRTIRRGRRMKLIIGEPVDPTAFAAVEELIAHVHERMKRTYDARRAEIVDGSSRAERMLAPVTAEPADQRG